VYLNYGVRRTILSRAGKGAPPALLAMASRYFDRDGILKEGRILDFHRFLNVAPRDNGHELRCYDDVMAYVAEHQDAAHRQSIVNSRFKEGIDSTLFDKVLKTPLYPYQRE
jgi:hypothetical protein